MPPFPNNKNNSDDLHLISQTFIAPLVAQIKELDGKVDRLNENYVTRADIEKLVGYLVPKELYETRHTALIARDMELEEKIKDVRLDIQDKQQKIHERLESGKQQLEDRQRQLQQSIDERFKEQDSTLLSNKDRLWIRWTQVISAVALCLTLLEFLAQHLKFN